MERKGFTVSKWIKVYIYFNDLGLTRSDMLKALEALGLRVEFSDEGEEIADDEA